MANEEQIGFHKGSLATLSKEREELVKMVKVVEQIMEAHVNALKELGVNLEDEAKKIQEQVQENVVEPVKTEQPEQPVEEVKEEKDELEFSGKLDERLA